MHDGRSAIERRFDDHKSNVTQPIRDAGAHLVEVKLRGNDRSRAHVTDIVHQTRLRSRSELEFPAGSAVWNASGSLRVRGARHPDARGRYHPSKG